MHRALILLILSSAVAFGEIIPSTNRITWQGNVGVKGGITNRTSVFGTSAKAAPYNAVGDGVNDDTAELQAYLDAGTAESVMYIPAGTYKVTASLVLKNSYTVRGDGTNTIINGTIASGDGGIFQFGTATDPESAWFPSPTTINITAGATHGSTSITLASTNGVDAGKFLHIDCLNESGLVSDIGNEGDQGFTSRDEGARSQRQIVEIVSRSGTTVTITPPLIGNFLDDPEAIVFTPALRYAGIEDLKVSAFNGASQDKNFQLYKTADCWIKNVESDYADGDHIHAASSTRLEFRDSYFHDGFIHGPGVTDDCVKITSGTSSVLIENNIFRRMHIGIMFWGGGGGHVVGYNYFTNSYNSGSPTVIFSDITYHGAHPMSILFEGNILNSFSQDGIWGTGSHSTLLRNFISGQNYINEPYDDGGREAETSTWLKQYVAARCISLAGYGNSKYFNVVGNRLGVPTMGNYPTFDPVYMVVAPTNRAWDHEGYIFTLGYANGSDDGSNVNDNSAPYDTLLNHGNWDVVNGAVTWDAGIADHDIPTSYYLTEKPDWFGALEWPNSTLYSSTMIATNQPAAHRWLVGDVPEGGGGETGVAAVGAVELRIGTIEVAP